MSGTLKPEYSIPEFKSGIWRLFYDGYKKTGIATSTYLLPYGQQSSFEADYGQICQAIKRFHPDPKAVEIMETYRLNLIKHRLGIEE